MPSPSVKPPRTRRQRVSNLERDLGLLSLEVTGLRTDLRLLMTNVDFAVQYMKIFSEKLGVDERLSALNAKVLAHMEERSLVPAAVAPAE